MLYRSFSRRRARSECRLARGDLRYVILSLLEKRSSYGYELIRELEERFHGLYAPSPGTVYPTLQWLHDLGYVTVTERDGRKVYTVTDEGQEFLAEHEPEARQVWERMQSLWSPSGMKDIQDELHEFLSELREMARELRRELIWVSPRKLRRVREVVLKAGREIDDILREREDDARESKKAARSPRARH